jgi:hypothetical protein
MRESIRHREAADRLVKKYSGGMRAGSTSPPASSSRPS